jgi:hypothetical protein
MDSGSTHLHVVPSLDGGWTLREVADGPGLSRRRTRRSVLDVAALMLARQRGGRISVHDVDGTVTQVYVVAARGRQVWWYQPPRLLTSILPVYFVLEAVLFLATSSSVPTWINIGMLVLGVLLLASVVASRLSDRRRGPLYREVVRYAVSRGD